MTRVLPLGWVGTVVACQGEAWRKCQVPVNAGSREMMRPQRLAIVATTLIALFIVGCGGGESKPESQVLEEQAFKAHSGYVLAEAELLNFRSKEGGRKYRREVNAHADRLLRECQEAITEEGCSVREPLESIVHEIDERTHRSEN